VRKLLGIPVGDGLVGVWLLLLGDELGMVLQNQDVGVVA